MQKKHDLVNNILHILHILVVLSFFTPFFVNDKFKLKIFVYWIIFIYLGWILLMGKCWLSDLQRNLDNTLPKDNDLVHFIICKQFNIKISSSEYELFFNILNLLVIFTLIYKLRFS